MNTRQIDNIGNRAEEDSSMISDEEALKRLALYEKAQEEENIKGFVELTIGGTNQALEGTHPNREIPTEELQTPEFNERVRQFTRMVQNAKTYNELTGIVIKARSERILGKLKHCGKNRINFQRVRYEDPKDEKVTSYKALRILKETIMAKDLEIKRKLKSRRRRR